MKKLSTKSTFCALFVATLSIFCTFTNAKAQSTPVDTLVNATGGTMMFYTEERLGGIDSGKSIMRQVYLYLSSDTSGFSIPIKTTWEMVNGSKKDSVAMTQPGSFWIRVKVTDTASMKTSWSRMRPVVITPVPKTGSISWVSKPQNLNDTVSMQFAYSSNVDGKIKIYKGLTGSDLYLSKVISVKADTIGKSLFDFYKVPSGIVTWYRVDFENAAGTITSSVEKATAAPTKRTAIVRADSIWNEGNTLKLKGYVNAFGSKTYVWVRYGTNPSDTNTSPKITYEGYTNQTINISIPNMNYGDKIYYEFNTLNGEGESKDIQGYYVMPQKPAVFDVVVNKVEGNFGKVAVTYTVYLAPNTTGRVGLYRDNNADMSSPEEQMDLEAVSQNGTIVNKVFENVPKGTWYYSAWGNSSDGKIMDHSNVIEHMMKYGLGIKDISLLTETVIADVYDISGKLLGRYEFSNTDYSKLPHGMVLFIRYTDPKGQVYAGKIFVEGGVR